MAPQVGVVVVNSTQGLLFGGLVILFGLLWSNNQCAWCGPLMPPPPPPSLSSINILAPPICNSGTQTPSSLLHIATTRSPVPHPFWCVQPNSVLATLRPPNSSPFYNHRHDTLILPHTLPFDPDCAVHATSC